MGPPVPAVMLGVSHHCFDSVGSISDPVTNRQGTFLLEKRQSKRVNFDLESHSLYPNVATGIVSFSRVSK